MRSPLLRPRWLGIHLGILLVAAVCVAGTAWQFVRAFEPDREVITNPVEDLAGAVPLDGLLEPGEYMHPETFANTAVTVTGRYSPEETLLVPRTEDGARGHDVILPLVTADGAAVTVDRGWIPEGAAAPEVPGGEVTVTVTFTGALVSVALGESFAVDRAQEQVEVLARDVGAAGVFCPRVSECLVAPHDSLG